MSPKNNYRRNYLAALKGISVLIFACIAVETQIAQNEDSQQFQSELNSRVKNLLLFYYQDVTTPIISSERFKMLIQDRPKAISQIEYVDNVDDQLLGKYLAVKFRGQPKLSHVYMAKEAKLQAIQQLEVLGIPATPLELSFTIAELGVNNDVFQHRLGFTDFHKMLSVKTASSRIERIEIVDSNYIGFYFTVTLKNDANAYRVFASKANLKMLLKEIEAHKILVVYLSFSCN